MSSEPTIRWTTFASTLGPMLLAASGRGICLLAFDGDEAQLRRRFPAAALVEDGLSLSPLVAQLSAAIRQPGAVPDLPLDVAGTPFQRAVWDALRAIPAGETRSYGDIARSVGQPGAVRAVGSACGANPVLLLIPCHRALRSDGGLGGYAGGVERKRRLLAMEGTGQLL